MNKQLNTKGKGGGQAQVGPSWLPVPIRLRQPHPYQSFLILPPNHVHAGFSSWVQATTGIWVTPYSHSSPFIPVPPFLTRVHTATNSTPLSLPGAWRSQESRVHLFQTLVRFPRRKWAGREGSERGSTEAAAHSAALWLWVREEKTGECKGGGELKASGITYTTSTPSDIGPTMSSLFFVLLLPQPGPQSRTWTPPSSLPYLYFFYYCFFFDDYYPPWPQ